MSQIKPLSLEEIKAMENEAFKKADALIEQHKNVGHNSPKKDFLKQIEKVLIKLLDDRVPYRKISTFIFDVYSFKISEQSIMDYAKNVLHYDATRRSKGGSKNTLDTLRKDIHLVDVKAEKKSLSSMSNFNNEDTL